MTTALLFVASLLLVVIAAELFTNAIEWAGHILNLGTGATGSLLAALGTSPAGDGRPGRGCETAPRAPTTSPPGRCSVAVPAADARRGRTGVAVVIRGGARKRRRRPTPGAPRPRRVPRGLHGRGALERAASGARIAVGASCSSRTRCTSLRRCAAAGRRATARAAAHRALAPRRAPSRARRGAAASSRSACWSLGSQLFVTALDQTASALQIPSSCSRLSSSRSRPSSPRRSTACYGFAPMTTCSPSATSPARRHFSRACWQRSASSSPPGTRVGGESAPRSRCSPRRTSSSCSGAVRRAGAPDARAAAVARLRGGAGRDRGTSRALRRAQSRHDPRCDTHPSTRVNAVVTDRSSRGRVRPQRAADDHRSVRSAPRYDSGPRASGGSPTTPAGVSARQAGRRRTPCWCRRSLELRPGWPRQ